MSRRYGYRSKLGAAGLLVVSNVVLVTVVVAPAAAAVSVSRAQVTDTQLRLEGTATASRDITVDGVVMGRSSTSGTFRISRDPFTAPADCTVDVRDGSATVTVAQLSGCSVTGAPPPPPPPPGDAIAPTAPSGLAVTVVGSTISVSWGLSTDNTAVAGYRLTRNGTVRATTTIDTTFLDTGLAAGTYTYSVAAFDAAGNSSAQSNSVSAAVAASEALGFITPSQLPAAVVGEPYLGYVVASDPPGPSSFRFRLVSGRVPAGTTFSGNTLATRPEARVTGTPTAVGTSTFSVEVSDGTGATARRTFTITVTATAQLTIPAGVNALDPATVGVSYSGLLPVSGGGPIRTWAIISGTPPPGLALGVGVVWGIPTAAGTYVFSARVTDNLGATTSGQFSVTVVP